MNGDIFGGGIMETWMFDTMVSMTLLMALVLLVRKPVSHFFGAHISYLLWVLPLARLFMPTLTLTAPAPVEPVAALAPTLIATDLAASAPAQQMAASAFASVDWLLVAAILWIGGAGLLFLSKLAGYFQFREDIISDGHLVGRHGTIKILETAAVRGPLAFGLFDKYIAVPNDFFRNYAPRERELALEHEIAHHESGDLAANFAGLLVLSLHWFNPVAWFAWIAFRQDQETACDARILQKGGKEVRAVYGRTIAKSASGLKLGLASPLNQKDKIKGRLKMLGQSEKSSLRKRLGALLVGVGTVVALPATATVTYAVEPEVEDVDIAVPIAPEAPLAPLSIAPPAAPAEPSPVDVASIDELGDTTNITMLNGSKDFKHDKQYVHRVKHDGRTIVLRTNKKLSRSDVREMVIEAEESRREADEELREMKFDREELREEMRESEREMKQAEREMKQAEREMKAAEREWQSESKKHSFRMDQEVRDAIREAQEEAREAVRDARESMRDIWEAEREVKREARSERRQTSSVWSIAQQVSNISFAPKSARAPHVSRPTVPALTARPVVSHSISDCKAMNKQIAFGGKRGGHTDQAWAAVAGCANFEVRINRTALMKATLRGLEKSRVEAANCRDKDKAKKLRAFDRDIKELRSRLTMT